MCRKYAKIWSNFDKNFVSLQITAIDYYEGQDNLVLGDETGHITLWSIKSVI